MAKNLIWHDLSMRQIYEFNSLKTSDAGIKFLSDTFSLDLSDEKNSILAEFFYYALMFARDQGLTPEQASCFFSIMKQTHIHCTSTPFMTLDKDYTYFKDLLLQHCVQRPPYSQKVFSFEDMKKINDWAGKTYFRHYHMYKYAFTPRVKLDFITTNAELTPAPSFQRLIDDDQILSSDIPVEINPENQTPSVEAESVKTPATNLFVPLPSPIDAAATNLALNPAAAATAGSLQPADQAEDPMASLRDFITSTLSSKMDELKVQLQQKLVQHEEQLNKKIGADKNKKK